MNTEANAGAGGNTATTLKDTGRKWPRIAGRAMLLTLGLLAAAAGIFYLAGMMRGIMEDMALADRGEWASLLGGGLGVWAFFLIRSGIVEKALDLFPKTKTVLNSLPATRSAPTTRPVPAMRPVPTVWIDPITTLRGFRSDSKPVN